MFWYADIQASLPRNELGIKINLMLYVIPEENLIYIKYMRILFVYFKITMFQRMWF